MKVGIMIGAGASAAINPKKVPLMNNFFEVVRDFAKRDKQVTKTLKTLRKSSLLSRVTKGNLEDVLTQTLALPRTQEDPWERPYDGLLLTLHRVLHTLDKNEDLSSYIDCLSPLSELDPKDLVFISFNYDVFLERALEALFSWSADFGYSDNVLVGYINAEQADKAESPTQICDEKYAWPWDTPPDISFPSESTLSIQHGNGPIVLKPHGSLNWFIHGKGRDLYWMSNKTKGLILMRPINGETHVPSFWIYPTTNTVNGELANQRFQVGSVLPAIIPPGEEFSKNIAPFRRIEKSVKDALSQVAALVVVGWSMRQSDRKYQHLFASVRATRTRKLDVTAVCDFHQEDKFYSRFQKLLPTKKFLRCDEGFITQHAKELLENVAKQSLTM